MAPVGNLASAMMAQAVNSSDMAGTQSWSAGGINEIALHAIVGGAVARLGGRNALQGALGAQGGGSEAAIPCLEQYGNNGVLAGTALIGGLVGVVRAHPPHWPARNTTI